MQANTIATTKAYIPVNESVLKKILKAMGSVGILWDGTVNHIDSFCLKDCRLEWLRLTPNRKTKKVVYIQYDY